VNTKNPITEEEAPSSGLERLTYSPAEFAELFGKSPTWTYRLLYANKIKAISGFGRTLVPRAEAERILRTMAPYQGAGLVEKSPEAQK
jgi:hypothetical protein